MVLAGSEWRRNPEECGTQRVQSPKWHTKGESGSFISAHGPMQASMVHGLGIHAKEDAREDGKPRVVVPTLTRPSPASPRD